MIGRGLYTVVFILLLMTGSKAQISFSDYLSSEVENIQASFPAVESSGLSYKAPLVRRWDFRMDTDEFLLERQEYEIRGNLSTRAIRKYQNKLYEGYEEELRLEQIKTRQIDVQVIYDRYLQSYFAQKETTINQAIIPYINDQILMLKKVDANGELSLYDYLEKERQLNLIEWDLSKKAKLLESLLPAMNQVISIEGIESFVETTNLKLRLQYPDFFSDQLDIERIEDEYNLEVAQANQVLDFFRVNYNGPHTDPFEERLSVGVATNFRRSEKRELDLIELQLEKKLEEEQMVQRQLKFKEDVSEALLQFRTSVELYYSFEKLFESLEEQQAIIDAQNPVTKRDILKWLDLKIDYQKNKEKLVQYEKEVFEAYLDWLNVSGIMDQYYSVDFLSPVLSSDVLLMPVVD